MSWFDHNREVTEPIVDLLYRSAANHAVHPRMICNQNQAVESLTVVDLPLVFTDSMPLSQDASLAYIWLEPIIW